MATPIRKVLDDAKVLYGRHPQLARSVTVARAALGEATFVTIQTGAYSFVADEPRAAGGGGAAPSPVQLALGSLAACAAISYRYWSEMLSIAIDSVDVEARGDADVRGFLGFDPDIRPGPSVVQVDVTLSGPESEERYRQLHAAVEAHCPVLAVFANGTRVETTMTARAGATKP